MTVSLRNILSAAAPGAKVVAYLTIGDPPRQFVDVASEVIEAGALALELGFPHPEPREGEILLASHRRALGAGVTTEIALRLLTAVAQRRPAFPIVAVVQASALEADPALDRFLAQLAQAGAAAVLPVGLPLWKLPSFSTRLEQHGLQTVFPCAPNASAIYRRIALRHCTGGIYVPRAQLTGSSQEFANVADFCRLISAESDTPIIVGVGVRSAEDVAEICAAEGTAAAVGTALVDHVARGGSAGDFVRRLLSR